jgi:predicted DNA-binding transcriptional regulator AlpA
MEDRQQCEWVARKLGVSVSMVYKMAARGQIPGTARIGRRWTFDPVKLEASSPLRKVKRAETRKAC